MSQPLFKIATTGEGVMLRSVWTMDDLNSLYTSFTFPPESDFGGIVLRRGESICFEHGEDGLIVYRASS